MSWRGSVVIVCVVFLLGVLAWLAAVNVRRASEALVSTAESLCAEHAVQAPRASPDQRAAACEVRSILASSNLPPGLDPGLAFLRRQLFRPPFASFRRFELLLTARLRFDKPKQARATMLANKSMLALSYLGREQARLRFRLFLEQSLAGTVFSVAFGKTLLVCCDSLPDGSQQIISLTCGT